MGGEGLCGVVIAGVVFCQKMVAEDPTADQPLPLEIGQGWATRLAEYFNTPVLADVSLNVLATIVFALVIVYFALRCRATG